MREKIAIKYEFLMNNLTMSGTQQEPYSRRAHVMSQMGLLECEDTCVCSAVCVCTSTAAHRAVHRKRTYRVTSQHNIVSISNVYNKALDFMLLFFCNLPAPRTIRKKRNRTE